MNFAWRARVLWIIILTIFFALFVKLLSLMTAEQKFLSKQGASRSFRVKIEHMARGEIYDRNHKILAQSFPSGKIWIFDKYFTNYQQDKKLLNSALNIDYKYLMKQHEKNKIIVLKNSLSPSELSWVEQKNIDYLNVEKFDKRYYPLQEAAGSLLGLVNKQGLGQEGVERAYDDLLQSEQGKLHVESNRKGAIVKVNKVIKQSRKSPGLVLTIDSEIQDMMYNILAEGVQKVTAESGVAILVKPSSGEIFAMVNYPGFNPNNTEKVNFSDVKNRAITDIFEPGSTMKPFTIATALANKSLKLSDEIDTANGEMMIYGHKIEDEFHKHGMLSVSEILKKSSNVGITKIAMAMPADKLPTMLDHLGFGHYGLYFPGETPGHITQKAWQHGLEQATLAFGYGISVNALQLVHAYAILANNGVDPGIYLNKSHDVKHNRVIPKQVAKSIREMLVHVTDYGGTAHAAKIPGLEVAGKTGTARLATSHGYKKSYISSFVGMFPAKSPEWVILVVVKKPNMRYYFGGQSAAPIFAKIGAELQRLSLIRKHSKLPSY